MVLRFCSPSEWKPDVDLIRCMLLKGSLIRSSWFSNKHLGWAYLRPHLYSFSFHLMIQCSLFDLKLYKFTPSPSNIQTQLSLSLFFCCKYVHLILRIFPWIPGLSIAVAVSFSLFQSQTFLKSSPLLSSSASSSIWCCWLFLPPWSNSFPQVPWYYSLLVVSSHWLLLLSLLCGSLFLCWT